MQDAVASHHVPVAVLGQQIARAKSKSEKQTLTKKLHSMLEVRSPHDRSTIHHFATDTTDSHLSNLRFMWATQH